MAHRRTSTVERRQAERFPLELEVRYTLTARRGTEEKGDGKTVNISSCGILFTCEHQLAVGRKLKLCVSWPILLNDKVALKLVVRGRVVRVEEGRVAIEIQQHEFRTQSPPRPGESKSG